MTRPAGTPASTLRATTSTRGAVPQRDCADSSPTRPRPSTNATSIFRAARSASPDPSPRRGMSALQPSGSRPLPAVKSGRRNFEPRPTADAGRHAKLDHAIMRLESLGHIRRLATATRPPAAACRKSDIAFILARPTPLHDWLTLCAYAQRIALYCTSRPPVGNTALHSFEPPHATRCPLDAPPVSPGRPLVSPRSSLACPLFVPRLPLVQPPIAPASGRSIPRHDV